MAGSDELLANSNIQTSSSSSPRGDLHLKEAERVLSRAGLSGAAAAGGASGAINKSRGFFRKLLSFVTSSSGGGVDDESLEQSEAREKAVDLLQKAATEYHSAKLLGNAAQCYERAAELQNFGRIRYTSFTILSKASKCYEENFQYDKAEQSTLKLINMATEINNVSRIAQFNCELANIYVLKQLYSEASKHYERAYNLYRVADNHFTDCNKMLEKQANLSILQNDFEAAAKYFVLIFEAYHNHESLRFNSVKYFVKACLSFLVGNPKKSSDYFKEKQQNANFLESDLAMVVGIFDAVREKNYDNFKSLIGRKYSYTLDLDSNLRDIVFAIEKKYFIVENGSEKKYGKLPAADDDINLENLLDDGNIERADHNKSKNINNDNSPTAPGLPNSSPNALAEEDDDDDIDLR